MDLSGAPLAPLSTFTAADLAALYINSRALIMSELVAHVHSVILENVVRGKRSLMIDHMHMHTDWLKNEEFIAEFETTLRALFPDTTIAVVTEMSAHPRVSFSY